MFLLKIGGIENESGFDVCRELCSAYGELFPPSEQDDTVMMLQIEGSWWMYVKFVKRIDAELARKELHDRQTEIGKLIVDWYNISRGNQVESHLPSSSQLSFDPNTSTPDSPHSPYIIPSFNPYSSSQYSEDTSYSGYDPYYHQKRFKKRRNKTISLYITFEKVDENGPEVRITAQDLLTLFQPFGPLAKIVLKSHTKHITLDQEMTMVSKSCCDSLFNLESSFIHSFISWSSKIG